MRDEIARRQTNTAKLRAFFLAQPMTWIPAVELEAVAGRQAWRTRVSELRRELEREDLGTIENHLSKLGGITVSTYRYLPYVPLGRDAGSRVSGQRELRF